MPAYKHPCPHCGRFIQRDAAACPFCGAADPFAPARCLGCGRAIEDSAWTVCPSCGAPIGRDATPPGTAARSTGPGSDAGARPQPQGARPADARAAADASTPPARDAGTDGPSERGAATCSGCGAPLPVGARFCTICGTLAG